MDLLLFPFNGNSIEALDCLADNYHLLGFIDDDITKVGKKYNGISCFDKSVIDKYPNAKILAVPGSPSSFLQRVKIIENLNISENRFSNIIHPKVSVSKYAEIGYNCLIMAGVVITSNAKIGNNCIVLPNTVIHHDSIVNDYSIIGSNVTVAGFSEIGKNCYIGAGTTIKNNIKIGKNTLVGSGSNVISDLDENSVYVGNPAKKIENE
jgi:sugar O-acyltransferase (sialic acid O-acetyltransferase NeuD family)